MPLSSSSARHGAQDRFTAEELQSMVDLYASGVASRVVAERFGVNQRTSSGYYKHGAYGDGPSRRNPCDRPGISVKL